jgi:hypothetical protein
VSTLENKQGLAKCLAKWKISILRAKKGVYLTKKRHLANCLTLRKKRLFLSFFMLDNVLGTENWNGKKVFTLKKIKKYFEKNRKMKKCQKNVKKMTKLQNVSAY